MNVLIAMGSIVCAGMAVLGFLAGKAKSGRVFGYWCLGGLGWIAAASGAFFGMKATLKTALVQLAMSMSNVPAAKEWPVFLPPAAADAVIRYLFFIFLPALIVIFLLCCNCRACTKKWYWALLWSIGIFAGLNYALTPLLYGILGWMCLYGFRESAPFVTLYFPACCVMLAVLIAAFGLWLWHNRRNAARCTWRGIPVFCGIFAGFTCLLWLSTWSVGIWAKRVTDRKAAELGVTPCRFAEGTSPEVQAEADRFSRHLEKYSPPFSGARDWDQNAIPADVMEHTLKTFDSPEMRRHLQIQRKDAARLGEKAEIPFSALGSFRSLARACADRASLFAFTGQQDKILPELMQCPGIDALIAPDTPSLICESIRWEARRLWTVALVRSGPEEKSYLPMYRELFAWSRTWRVRLPCEAGFHLCPNVGPSNAWGAFISAPCVDIARYRGFFTALGKIPMLKELERQEVISGDDVFVSAARKQRLNLALTQTAVALKVFRVEHGKYPERLAELVPNCLDREPVSPYSGKRFSYVVKDGSFTLASDREEITSKKFAPSVVSGAVRSSEWQRKVLSDFFSKWRVEKP